MGQKKTHENPGRQIAIPDVEVASMIALFGAVGIIAIVATVVAVKKTIQWRRSIALVENAADDSVFDCKFSDGLGFRYNTRLEAAQLLEANENAETVDNDETEPEIMTF